MINKEAFRARWYKAAEVMEVPKEAYTPSFKVVEDKNYSFGITMNPHRFNRPQNPTTACPLCEIVETAERNPALNLLPEEHNPDFVVIPNKFPFYEMTSLAVAKKHKPIYPTHDLTGVSQEMSYIFGLGRDLGMNVVHNTPGAGASIPGHEHWHFLDFDLIHSLAGRKIGMDNVKDFNTVQDRVLEIPNFPFAHLIFRPEDAEHITYFLSNLGDAVGHKFPDRSAPHLICQAGAGIVIAPVKTYIPKGGPGGGDVAGHITCRSAEELAQADFPHCMNKLGSALFPKDEISLRRFL